MAVEIPYHGRLLAGVDEAGRGPLAGGVVAAAVILDKVRPVAGLADSKKLPASRREMLAEEIIARACAYGIGRASVAEIDRINILQASLLAMRRAVAALAIRPEYVVVDGNRCPDWDLPSRGIIKGDSRVAAISAAGPSWQRWRVTATCVPSMRPGRGMALAATKDMGRGGTCRRWRG